MACGDGVEAVGADQARTQAAPLKVVAGDPAHREVQAAIGDPGSLHVRRRDPGVDEDRGRRGGADVQVSRKPVDVAEADRF